MAVTVVTAAALEPLTACDIRTHLGMDLQESDSFLESKITVAREYAETVVKRRFITTSMRLSMLGFYDSRYADLEDGIWTIRVPEPPFLGASEISYINSNGTSTVLSSSLYQTDTYSEPGRITPAYNTVWPETRHQRNSVTVLYTAGYGAAASSVPESVKEFIKFSVAGLFEYREPSIEASCQKMEYLLDPVRWGSYV